MTDPRVTNIIDQYYEKKGELYGLIEQYIDPINGRFTEDVYRILGDADGVHLHFRKRMRNQIQQLQPEERANPDLQFAKQDYEEAFDELEHALQRGVLQVSRRQRQQAGRSRKHRHSRRRSQKRKSRKTRSKKV